MKQNQYGAGRSMLGQRKVQLLHNHTHARCNWCGATARAAVRHDAPGSAFVYACGRHMNKAIEDNQWHPALGTIVEKRAIDVQPGDIIRMEGMAPRWRDVLRTTLCSDERALTISYVDGHQEVVQPDSRMRVLKEIKSSPMGEVQAMKGDGDPR